MAKKTGPKSIQILRPGTFTDMNGARHSFGEADLRGIADAYDPGVYRAPIVVGHPKNDAPAYGHVADVQFKDAGLEATPADLEPAFAEAVNAGRYLSVSASFYGPKAPNNPAPGSYSLRHVGFLGAAPPAVKGLRPVELAEDDEGVVNIEFADQDSEEGASKRLLQALTGLFERFAPESPPAFSEQQQPKEAQMGDDDKKAAEAEAKLKAQQDKLKAAQEALAAEQAAFAEKAAKAEAETTIDERVKEGKVLPKDRDGLVNLMAALSGIDQTIEFADGKSGKPAAYLTEFLKGLPKQVEFSEAAKAETDDQLVDLSDAEAIAAAANKYKNEQESVGNPITIVDAVDHVTKETKS